MSSSAQSESGPEHYTGTVRVPGTDDIVDVDLEIDLDQPAVSVDFGEPIAGATRWEGGGITVRRLQKYVEVHFLTDGLPVDGVALQWKANVSNVDGTVAGVVIAKPNASRVSGEMGFVLNHAEAGS